MPTTKTKQKKSACPSALKHRRAELRSSFARPGLPTLIVAALNDVQLGSLATMRARLRALRVSSILNVTEEPPSRAVKEQVYDELDIYYVHRPLFEDPRRPPTGDFFTAVAAFYVDHLLRHPTRALLVHCRAGCNRSGIALATLLWLTSPKSTWPSIDTIRECMRESMPLFIQHDSYIVALRRWVGEERATAQTREWAGAGIRLRKLILTLQRRRQTAAATNQTA